MTAEQEFVAQLHNLELLQAQLGTISALLGGDNALLRHRGADDDGDTLAEREQGFESPMVAGAIDGGPDSPVDSSGDDVSSNQTDEVQYQDLLRQLIEIREDFSALQMAARPPEGLSNSDIHIGSRPPWAVPKQGDVTQPSDDKEVESSDLPPNECSPLAAEDPEHPPHAAAAPSERKDNEEQEIKIGDVFKQTTPERSQIPEEGATRLRVLQLRRELHTRDNEVSRLRDRIRALEGMLLDRAAPRAVMMEVAELRERNVALEAMLGGGGEPRTFDKRLTQSNEQQYMGPGRASDADAMKEAHAEATVTRWHEGKKLQVRIEALKRKLEAKTSEASAAAANATRLEEQLKRVQKDLTKSEAQGKALRAKIEASREGPRESGVPASAVQSLLTELNGLQQRNDYLERQSALGAAAASRKQSLVASPCASGEVDAPRPYDPRQYSSGNSVGPPSGNCESQIIHENDLNLRIFDLEIERDQAAAHARRLQTRLSMLLDELGQNEDSDTSNQLSAKKSRRNTCTDREQELLDTVALLRTALERTRKGFQSGVSSARYMQAVERAKRAGVRIRELKAQLAEAEGLKQRLTEAQRETTEARVTISALRSQLRHAKRCATEDLDERDQVLKAQVAELERALRERDAQLAALRHPACEQARTLVAEGLTPKMLVKQLLSAREELASLQQRLHLFYGS